MKHFKSILALVLALVMVLSCVGTSFAARKTEIKDIPAKTNPVEKKDVLKGFKNETFKELNSYQYADDEIVRAIVILEGEAEAEVAENGSEKAAAHRVKLVNQHNAVRKAMSGIKYEMKFDFTRLLNGFSCDVAYGDLEAIDAIEGVKAVYIANSYSVPEVTEEDPNMNYVNNMTGNFNAINEEGANGAGIVVAVLDTGLNTTHEAFRDADGLAAASAKLSEEDVAAAMENLHGKGKYLSAKVPFSYDYANGDNDVTDHDGHGTHVSGIAVGYAVTETEDGGKTIDFCGASPAAQLLSMKIFRDDKPGTSSDIYFYALEDAYTLGADVVNMSIGSQNGFTYDASLEDEVFGNIYKTMEEAGIIMSVAAGNEYSMADFSSMGYIGADYTDYGTIATPAAYEGNIAIASVENFAYPIDSTMEIAGEIFEYIDSSTEEKDSWKGNFGGKTIDYVVVKDAEGNFSLGLTKDYANVDVKGKIAVVSRGEISFEEKVEFAYNAGAIGCIVVNNDETRMSMSIETFEVPAVSVMITTRDIFLAAPEGQLTVADGPVDVENPDGWMMSEFSNWGTSPSLTLDPTLSSVGGMVYSSVIDGDDAYAVYSGTSMAAPNATGTFANVLTAIYEKYPEMSKVEAAELAKDLLIGTATVLVDADGYLFSPRKQGAGLADAMEAIRMEREGAYIANPIVELGDDAEKKGVYSFDVELVNNTDKDVVYFADSVTMIDYIANLNTEANPIYGNTMTSDYLKETVLTVDNEEATPCYYANFKDCTDPWYHEYVDIVCEAELMMGVSPTKFAPNAALTRAMAVTVLYRLAGSPAVSEPTTFADVPAGQWYSDAIAWAEDNGIVKGVSATKFAPDVNVTREQIATILWRAWGEEIVEADMSEFKDTDSISAYAKDAMNWVVANEIMKGDHKARLNPQANATRAEFAAIMARVSGSDYACGTTYVTVPANGKKTVNVTLTLSKEDKFCLDKTFPNGSFIEGFVEFYNEDCYTHATYLAYYGDWTQAPVLEETDYRDVVEAIYWQNTNSAEEGGHADKLEFYTNPNVALLTDSAITEAYAYLGDNMLGEVLPYNPDHAAFSTPLSDGTNNYAELLYMTPYMLRNARHLIMTVSNKETGEVYFVDDTEYLPKAIYDVEEEAWMATGLFTWDGKDAKGEYVPSGTVATITYDAVLPYGEKEVKDIWGMDVTVDYTAPVIESVEFDAETGTITATASDEQYLQAIYLSNADYELLDAAVYSSDKKGESFTATFDVNEYIEAGELELWVVALDYATNELEEHVYLFETGKEATITLVTPMGEEKITTTTGEIFTFTTPEEAPEDYYFEAWVLEEVEEATYEEILGMYQAFPGDEIVVDQDYTFYALYAVGGAGTSGSKSCYYLDYGDNYDGDWALCGWNTDADNYFIADEPVALTNTGETINVLDIPDVEHDPEYLEFYTNSKELSWTIKEFEEGSSVYTIQGTNGYYLTLTAEGKLTFAPTLTSYGSLWIIFYAEDGHSTSVFNYQNRNAYLCYDYIIEQFTVHDATKPLYGTAYTAPQVFGLEFYRCEAAESGAAYYTTK